MWQAKAAALVTEARLNAQTAGHAYPILGVAQYLAVQQAEAAAGDGGRNRLEAERGAVSLGGCVNTLSP